MTTARRAWHLVLATSLVPFALWTAVRLSGVEHGAPFMQLMSFTPYVAAAALVPLAAALLSRGWWQAGAAGLLVLSLAACVLPRALADPGAATGPAGAPRLRVLTANLLLGGADAATVVRLVTERRTDVLAVQELTPDAARRLDAAGLARLLPYRKLNPVSGGAGAGLYSRYPLHAPAVRRMPGGHTQVHATIQVPGARPLQVESVHPEAPSNDTAARQWAREMALEPPATTSGDPRVLLGDFNSTLDHDGLRRLIGTGYRDAAEVAGAGLEPTWPFISASGMGRVPPVTIDHVLADARIGVVSVHVLPVPGSDHRAVSAVLVLF